MASKLDVWKNGANCARMWIFFFLKQVCRWYIFGVCMLLVFQDLLERQFVFFAMLHFVKYVSGEDLDKSIKQIVIVFFISYLFDAFLCFSFVEIRMFCLYNIHCFLFYFLTNVQRIGNRNIRQATFWIVDVIGFVFCVLYFFVCLQACIIVFTLISFIVDEREKWYVGMVYDTTKWIMIEQLYSFAA